LAHSQPIHFTPHFLPGSPNKEDLQTQSQASRRRWNFAKKNKNPHTSSGTKLEEGYNIGKNGTVSDLILCRYYQAIFD